MLNVRMGVCKKPLLDISEDFVGKNAGFFWLLDGATPPMGELNHKHTRYFVEELDKALTKYSLMATRTEELLSNALEEVSKVFSEMGLVGYEYLPYSTAIIINVSNKQIEYSVLGDSTLGIRVNETVRIISDNRIKRIASKERREVHDLRSAGVDEKSEQYLSARKKLIETEKKYQNIEGGYWVAGLQPIAAHYAISGKVRLCEEDKLMIMAVSDGLERLVSVFKKYDDVCKLGDALIAKGDKYIFSQLRELERDNKNFVKSVSNRNDDASFVLITK